MAATPRSMNVALWCKDAPVQCRMVPVVHVRQNCSVIWCAQTPRGAVVDPGCLQKLADAASAQW